MLFSGVGSTFLPRPEKGFPVAERGFFIAENGGRVWVKGDFRPAGSLPERENGCREENAGRTPHK